MSPNLVEVCPHSGGKVSILSVHPTPPLRATQRGKAQGEGPGETQGGGRPTLELNNNEGVKIILGEL